MKLIILLLLFLFESNLSALTTIEAIGYGNTRDKALRSAFQNAVEQSVGIYVDSRSVVKNSKLIKNNILTFSNGYISYHTILSSKEQMGLWEVKISATIKEQKVLKSVKKLKLNPKYIDGSARIYARLVSQVKSKFDAEDLMTKFVEDTCTQDNFKSLVTLQVDSIELDIQKATRKYVPVTIKWSEIYNTATYIKVSTDFVNLIKNLGAKKVASFEMDGHSVDDFKTSKNSLCIVLIKNGKRKVTMWQFPDSFSVVHPIQKYSVWNRKCSASYSYNVSLINSKNKKIWESESYFSTRPETFNYLNDGIFSVHFTYYSNRGDFSALSPYYDVSEDKVIMYRGSLDIQLPIDEIKDLQQAKVKWVDK